VQSFGAIRENLLKYRAGARFEGVRVEKMAPEGYDLFVGGKLDPSFGPVVFFGTGGIFIEAFRDVANILCPAEPENIRKRLEQLRSYTVLQGLRGREPGDIDAFVDLVARVSMLLADHPEMVELDINPVRVFPRGKGVMALDARARIT